MIHDQNLPMIMWAVLSPILGITKEIMSQDHKS
jgi:hypothetical protein